MLDFFGQLFGLVVLFGILAIGFKFGIVNAVLPSAKIDKYLKSKNFKYIRHQKIKKP